MSSTFYANGDEPRPSSEDVVGVTSLIIWTITWIVVRSPCILPRVPATGSECTVGCALSCMGFAAFLLTRM